jgi:hypothetical protein
MTRDAIVEEVRAVRDEIAKKYDYDIDAIFVALRRMEAIGRGHHVSLAPRMISDRSQSRASRAAARSGAADDGTSRRR